MHLESLHMKSIQDYLLIMIANDEFLAIKICQGLRPKSTYKIPQLIFDKINLCWNADHTKRSKVGELQEFFFLIYWEKLEKKILLSVSILKQTKLTKN